MTLLTVQRLGLRRLHHLGDRDLAPRQLELVALLRLLVEQPEDLPNVWGFGMLRRWSVLAQ